MNKKGRLPKRIRIVYTDTYERAGALEACYAFGHLYMNPEAKVALVEQQYNDCSLRSFAVVGRVLEPDEITPDMRFCRLADGGLAAPGGQEALGADDCTFVLPAIFPERLRSESAVDVMVLALQDGAYASSEEMLQALAELMDGYHEALRRQGLVPYGVSS